MQYSYESWLSRKTKTPDSHAEAPEKSAAPAVAPTDLKALEQTLPLGLEEGLQSYRMHQAVPQMGLWRENTGKTAEEAHWEDFAKLVADHVLAYMLDNPLQAELQDLRIRNDAFHKDNHAMAEQTHKLIAENEQLRNALHRAEQELASYHKVAGGFFIKR